MAVIVNGFERCCRLCAEEQDVTILIFSAEAEAMLLRNKLNKYLLIEVDEDDKLPKNICLKCCSTLQTVCDFIDNAHKAQAILMNRSLILDEITILNNVQCLNNEIKLEPCSYSDDESKITSMEVSVDPMVVLQNSGRITLDNVDHCQPAHINDVTYLHGIDGEDVTIKLIKRGENIDLHPIEDHSHANKTFLCKSCNQSFHSDIDLRKHSWVHYKENKTGEFSCSSCGDGFQHKNDLLVHLKKHRTSSSCKICGRVFRTEKNLAAHVKKHSSGEQKFSCKICGRFYNTMSNLKTHSITHSTERPYHCHLCKKSFKRKQDLKFHTNQHTGDKPYKCPFCDKSFASSGNCYSHRSRMHPGRRIEAKLKKPRETRIRTAPSRENFSANHTLQLRPIAPKPSIPLKSVLKYKCTLCEHSFVKRDNYMYHMYQHTGQKPFKCSFCTEEFVTRKGLLLHHEKEHPETDRPLALLSRNALLK